jgi:hypothetical protein
VTVRNMSERVPVERISATIVKDLALFDRIRNESKDKAVKFTKQAVHENYMFHAGCEIRADWPGSCHNLISMCCGRPRGPYTAKQAKQAWEITGGGKGLGFDDFQSFTSFTQKQVKPSDYDSKPGKNSENSAL